MHVNLARNTLKNVLLKGTQSSYNFFKDKEGTNCNKSVKN